MSTKKAQLHWGKRVWYEKLKVSAAMNDLRLRAGLANRRVTDSFNTAVVRFLGGVFQR